MNAPIQRWIAVGSHPSAWIVAAFAILLAPAPRAEEKPAAAAATARVQPVPNTAMGPAIPENAAELEALGIQIPAAGSATSQRAVPARPLSPMAAEMFRVLDDEKRKLGELQARFKEAPDAQAALAIQREIEKLKTNTELSLLRVQATFARRAGRVTLAQEIEAAIEEILHPRVPLAPVESKSNDRPAPR